MVSSISPPSGVFVPVPTFFQPTRSTAETNGSNGTKINAFQPVIDVPTQVRHSVHLAQRGIHGLVLLGSTGEAIHLSREERFSLISGVRSGLDNAGFQNYPIMAGVLVNSIDETLQWLQDSTKAGAQWGLVLAPGYFGQAVSQENLIEWYTIVADQSPIPILM